MPVAPATITCGSCGMQYDGTGMKSGVQFKCTQCGNMVMVGAPAGGKKPMGKPTRGPGAMAKGARPGMRGPAGPAGAPVPQNGGTAPAKKNNGVLIVGVISGVCLLAMIGLAIGLTSSQKSSQEAAKQAEEQKAKDDKAKQLKENEVKKAEGEARAKTIDAGTAGGERIASMLTNGDLAGLGSMFNWDIMQKDYIKELEKRPKDQPMKDGKPELDKNDKPKPSEYQKMLNDPLYSEGEWEKRPDGSPSGLWVGRVPRGSDSLRERIMKYIENTYAKAAANMDTAAMEKVAAKGHDRFSMTIDGVLYLGRVCMIKSAAAGKPVNFFVGSTPGDTNVKILRFDDPQRMENLKQLEAKFQRKEQPQNDESFKNPDRDPNKEQPGEEGDPEGPTDPGLPEAQKTGGQCPQDLVNIMRDLRDGKDLTNPQVKTLQDQSRSKADRKAFIGALVDMLIDFYKEKKRTECEVISKALFKVWGNGCGYDEKTATFDRQTFDENTTDFPVRVWYDYYTRYKA
ncbi:hypothetical protein PLCT2_00819 [Planctomycetaceae bacterium]|nr:hypothetical protein PLCT2_00819 [Planctomycetaceae bacterium]